jgi:citrate synthase
MIWLMTRGEMPTEAQARLLEHALVAAVDHGPQAPSIAAARMAVTCGLGLNGAMASAVNMLDDVHGGAGEQAVELMGWIDAAVRGGGSAGGGRCDDRPLAGGAHALRPRLRPPLPQAEDPRAPRLLSLVDEAAAAGTVWGVSPPSAARSRPRWPRARASPCR